MSISATTGRFCTAARRTLAIILLSSGLAILGAHPTLFDRSTTYALAISALAAAWGGFLLTCRNVRTSALPPTALLGPSSVLIGSAALSILFNADAAWSNILPLVA